jgi:hypothetical protein
MKEDTWGLVEITDPEKLKELNKPFVSQGYQKFRDDILRMLKYLSPRQRFNLIKNTDKELLIKLNTHAGTKAVHTLDYIKKFPSRKKNLTLKEELILQVRCLQILFARNDYYNERRKKMIRIIK